MRDAALAKINEDRQLFEGAAEKLHQEVEKARQQDSPISQAYKTKRVPYD